MFISTIKRPGKFVRCRIKGGLGNQLFCYAAARRLAWVNDAELVIDHVTGFIRDFRYKRRYALDRFSIPARKSTASERLEPFERHRRAIAKLLSRRKPFMKRHYLEQEGVDFDPRLLDYRVSGTVYLDGLWQSEGYFKDIEEVLRKDLRISPPRDEENQRMAAEIQKNLSVALHVRWFSSPDSADAHNVSAEYYQRAIDWMEERLCQPQYFLFSDDPDAARNKLNLPDSRVVFVSHNQGDEVAYADLWLMSLCQHYIIANSTFSWWGAWLSQRPEKIVLCPTFGNTDVSAWGFEGLIPDEWIKV